jgi:hypothetical protein
MDKLLASLQSLDMSLFSQHSVDDLVNDYLSQVNILIEENLDHKARRVSGNHHPWINSEYIKAAHERDKMFKRAKKERSQSLLLVAKKLRNKCTCLARKLKRDYFLSKIMKHKSNPKMLWRELKPLYKDSANMSGINSGKTDSLGHNYAFPLDIANAFLNHFDYGGLHTPVIVTDTCTSDSHQPVLEFIADTANPKFIDSLISKVNKNTPSLSSIDTRILQHCRSAFTKHFMFIFQHIIYHSTYPSVFKHALVKPIFKANDPNHISNFRPISLLPNINKFFELIIHHQLLTFCNENNILPTAQHGFRDNLSTETCLLDFFNSLYSFLDKKYVCLSVFVDFSKAFDLLNHSTLLHKLGIIGLANKSVTLVNSYLTHRTQQVSWEGCQSVTAEINCGVPQGSVLGPLLFCIYIHDMPTIFRHCEVFQYADDTTLLFHFNKKNYGLQCSK